jgi:hypothetical protein
VMQCADALLQEAGQESGVAGRHIHLQLVTQRCVLCTTHRDVSFAWRSCICNGPATSPPRCDSSIAIVGRACGTSSRHSSKTLSS